ncbi:MAG: ABC transporter ATP-binding protein [Deltaproteobacteria bacterium]|nr:ABC transporter ATP-binding protein [Deltaproteobacteria bacterium]
MTRRRIIEIVNYSYRIGQTGILHDVSMCVYEGEYLCVIGPNGAGKTTLLKCLDRINIGGQGVIRMSGRPLEEYSQKELAKLLSYVPQADMRMLPFSAGEFVLMGRYPHLSPFSALKPGDREIVEKAMKLTGTERFYHRPMGTLSGGECQKVLIAAALAQGAKVLLLDEPTTFLDPKHGEEVLGILARLNREEGITVVSVTHDINSAVLNGDRVVALREGSVRFAGPPAGLMNNSILEAIYDRRFLLTPHPQSGRMIVLPEDVVRQ